MLNKMNFMSLIHTLPQAVADVRKITLGDTIKFVMIHLGSAEPRFTAFHSRGAWGIIVCYLRDIFQRQENKSSNSVAAFRITHANAKIEAQDNTSVLFLHTFSD